MMIQPGMVGKTLMRGEANHLTGAVRFWAISLLLMLSAAGKPCIAAQDDYTKAIEAEGNQLEFLGQAKKEQEALIRHSAPVPAKTAPKIKTASPNQPEKTPSAPSTGSSAKLAVPISIQSDFEKSLQKNFPGSHALYSVLEPSDKKAVFNEYLNAGTEGTIRFLPVINKIIALSSKSNTR